VNLEIWRHCTLKSFGKLHSLVLVHYTLFQICDALACLLEVMRLLIPIHCEDGV
jgi:hypothetical protein